MRKHRFVPGRNECRGRSGKSRRSRDLESVPARTDLPGAGLRELAVLRVSGQGPVHVARPRAAVCEIPPRLETAEQLSTHQHSRVKNRLQSDRKSVVEGKSVSVRVDLGGGRIIKNKIRNTRTESTQ